MEGGAELVLYSSYHIVNFTCNIMAAIVRLSHGFINHVTVL